MTEADRSEHVLPELADASDPIALFRLWLGEAEASEPNDANAMTVATVDDTGRPTARILLLKGIDDGGFVFYTNFESRKGRELLGNPHAALCFHWKSLRRQVRVEGGCVPVSSAEADAYFESRPRGSRIGAWASDQSRPLDDRQTLIERVEEFERRFAAGAVPRPPHWSGFRLTPERIEFWRDREFRLHDRIVFTRTGAAWTVGRLYP